MGEFLLRFIFTFSILWLIILIIMFIKVEVMYRRHMRVLNAISEANDKERRRYILSGYEYEPSFINPFVIRPYTNEYIWNIFDWAKHEDLVPGEVYEKIKDYL